MKALSYQQEIYRKADRMVFLVIAILSVASFGIAAFFGTWTAALAVCVPTLSACGFLVLCYPAALPTRLANASALMILSALMIHEAGGLVEVHFGIFVLLAFLLYYRDWKPIVMASAVIAVHHVSSYFLEHAGVPVRIFTSGSGFGILVLHAGYVVFEAMVLVWMAINLKAESDATGDSATSLSSVANEIARGNLDVSMQDSCPLPGSIAGSILRMKNSLRETLTETERVLGAISAGDFSQTITEEGREGVGLRMAQSVNQTCVVLGQNMREVVRVSLAIAGGDLTQRATVTSAGELGQLSDNINSMAGFLEQFLNEQKNVLTHATAGNFEFSMATESRAGYQLELANGLNLLIQTCHLSLADVQRVIGAIAKGDLTQRIDAEFHGTFAQLKANSNATAQQLEHIVTHIYRASDAINTAANEIATGTRDLSARTEKQATDLEATAGSMERLTCTVKANSASAHEADQLAAVASGIAEDGGQLVEEVAGPMDEISMASKRIGDITGVIDGIAFQTNILALNAAVEAARAGEEGRGFAVVASEVRSLAQRSANAAKEIKNLIENSLAKVAVGSEQVEGAARKMDEVVASVKRVATIIRDIATASVEQSTGIEQMGGVISQMTDATQQNAALVEEASAATASLQGQAGQLEELMRHFKLVATRDIGKNISAVPRRAAMRVAGSAKSSVVLSAYEEPVSRAARHPK